jgi:hypothetical protein
VNLLIKFSVVADSLGSFQINPRISRYEILLRSKVLPTPAHRHSRIDAMLGSDDTKKMSPKTQHDPTKPAPSVNESSFQQLIAPDFIRLPLYCSLPSRGAARAMKDMTKWVRSKLLWKCHHKITSSKCYKLQYVDPFTPCLTSLQAALAEDYAWTRGWCSVLPASAEVPVLPGVEADEGQLDRLEYSKTPQKTAAAPRLRLGFLLTVYRDAQAVMRLLRHLHSPQHIYVVNVDSSSSSLASELRPLVLELGSNVFIATGTPVVYMASSASQILVQGMQWFLKYAGTFDYLIACTGSDYPLVPLDVMETILRQRSPPFPSVMNWNHATWEDARGGGRLSADRELAREVVLRERRPPHAPMESRGEHRSCHSVCLCLSVSVCFCLPLSLSLSLSKCPRPRH